jgi:hypothetical protein
MQDNDQHDHNGSAGQAHDSEQAGKWDSDLIELPPPGVDGSTRGGRHQRQSFAVTVLISLTTLPSCAVGLL